MGVIEVYNLHLTAREYPGAVRLNAVLSESLDTGEVRHIGHARERWLEADYNQGDGLGVILDAVRRWAALHDTPGNTRHAEENDEA